MEKSTSNVTCRSLGGLWAVIERRGGSPDHGNWSAIMTLGYNPDRKSYVGTFVASMMTHLWHYSGTLDDSGGKLTLDTEGPKCKQEGMARYQDIVEIIDDEHWVLSSQILGDDGKWQRFMTGHHKRVK